MLKTISLSKKITQLYFNKQINYSFIISTK